VVYLFGFKRLSQILYCVSYIDRQEKYICIIATTLDFVGLRDSILPFSSIAWRYYSYPYFASTLVQESSKFSFPDIDPHTEEDARR
jgi:hypothetical protein